ncbi:MAG: MFS transporter [Acetobacteraceae bacterium]|nr:MFS transporter [Acetobacteraceae bacterium]
MVNVALPTIGRELGGDAAGLQWIVNAYLLPLGALLLLGGGAGDRYGRKHVLLLGMGVFAAASALCAVAPGLQPLLAGRSLQGIGAALTMPNSLAVLGAAFEGEARGRAIGTWAAAGAVTSAAGPLLGGWLIETFGWRAIFLLNLPVAAAAIYLAVRFVDGAHEERGARLDWLGATLATAGLAGITYGLTVQSSGSGRTAEWLGAEIAGVALLGAFLVAERLRGARAMLPLALFGSRAFVGLSLLTLLLYGALGGLIVLLPFIMIVHLGYSALGAGAALLPLPLVIALASRSMGWLAAAKGARLPLTAGPMVVAAGFLLAMRIPAGGSYWTGILPSMLVIAAGMAGAVAPLTTAVLASVDSRHTGTASGFNSAIARTGGMLTTALLGAVLSQRGEALAAAFRASAAVAAALSLAAGLSAFILLRPKRRGRH